MEVLRAALRHLGRVAVVDATGHAMYGDVLARALQAASAIQQSPQLSQFPTGADAGPRVGLMLPPDQRYVACTLGTWLAGCIAVPLCLSHPPGELKYVVEDAQVALVLAAPEFKNNLSGLCRDTGAGLKCIANHRNGQKEHDAAPADVAAAVQDRLDRLSVESGSLIIYTSGTTGRPKGALHTHKSIGAQVAGLNTSWEWQDRDRILHALPLHHIHGIVNALYCPLATGAAVEFLPKFSPTEVWRHLQREEDPVTVFMGVPTMYTYLLSSYDKMDEAEKQKAKAAASRLRLTVSGSAACPIPIMERWQRLSGQRLLERYGMTEAGMLLSNPYRGERRPGSVGLPLPGVTVKSRQDGELAVCGVNLFREYWGKREATAESFDPEGFFLTGDTAEQEGDPPYWKILGRTSTDIINSGGYKVSALQIEDAILAHPKVASCAVLGVADEALGEAVVAVVSCEEQVSQEEIRSFAFKHVPRYQVPQQVVILDEIPRNAMGKVNKKALRKKLFPETA